jgi:hypothetical protein
MLGANGASATTSVAQEGSRPLGTVMSWPVRYQRVGLDGEGVGLQTDERSVAV